MRFYYKLQLFVKDKSMADDKSLYLIFLCTLEGMGKEFFPLDLGRKEPGPELLKKLRRVYKMLTRSWVEVDLIVEVLRVAGGQPVFFLVDTVLNPDILN